MPLRRQYRPKTIEIGLDEAGRGCLAGPVTAAAVVLMPGRRSPSDLNDSKQIPPHRREELRVWVEENSLAWAVGWCSPEEIDAENILQASMSAMHKALDQLSLKLDMRLKDGYLLPVGFAERSKLLLVDGHYWRDYKGVDYSCQKKGDGRFQSIAAASILAKTYRDAKMLELHAQHPEYSWNTNKGYGTPPHQRALMAHGPTEWHRRSFRLEY